MQPAKHFNTSRILEACSNKGVFIMKYLLTTLSLVLIVSCGDSNPISDDVVTNNDGLTGNNPDSYTSGQDCSGNVVSRFRSLVGYCQFADNMTDEEFIACQDQGRRFRSDYPGINCFVYVTGVGYQNRPYYDNLFTPDYRYRVTPKKIRRIAYINLGY